MEDLSLHILDIAENSINAGATLIDIVIREQKTQDMLTLEIRDNGTGMDDATVVSTRNPFYTTRTTRRIGLGLPLLEEATRAADGMLEIVSRTGAGTDIRATFRLSHIDRKPLGDMAATIVMLVAGNPDINFTYRHEHESETFTFSTKEIRLKYPGLDFNSPETLSFIRDYIREYTASFS
ncbi:MAG: sensor histidine kinase [Ignavibacteriae bacterium]|nr:sensor histidine kinase [Ignavibacteriota bacterium]